MNVTHDDNDPREAARLFRGKPNSWRTSLGIRRIMGGMNKGSQTLHTDGTRPATPLVSSPSALHEGRHRLAHEVPE